jgi:hypothetical protein
MGFGDPAPKVRVAPAPWVAPIVWQCATSPFSIPPLHRYKGLFLLGEIAVPTSVLEAIKLGLWDFEPPDETLQEHFRATHAMPGTPDKLDVLAERVRLGQPLWHPADRQDYDDPTDPSAN